MSQVFKPGFKIGILGGGQLARMLALSAHTLGAVPCVLSEKEDDPAQQVVDRGYIGKLDDTHTLETFASNVDVLTFESEFIDCEILAQAIPDHKKKIFPSLTAIRILQDRMTQKTLLDTFKVPTAEWLLVESDEDAVVAAETFDFPFVIKKRRNGYDGYGTYVIKAKKDLIDFINNHLGHRDGFIAEQFIPYERELACIFSRDQQGNILQFPLVESLQKDARCFWVKGPIKHTKFATWSTKFKKLIDKLDYVGTIGVELFETKDALIVNELAPRVHNTGHYTQNAFPLNQFDAHIRAVSNLELNSETLKHAGFAMVNLLGSKNGVSPSWVLGSDVYLHWYGKAETRAGRKMGHINAVGKTPEAALKTALGALKGFKI